MVAALVIAVAPIASADVTADAADTVAYRVYVDASAEAGGDGSQTKPFDTIEDAKNHVKTLDKTKGDIVVEIADGVYELSETLRFDASDSGNENCEISYVAAEGAYPLISGGQKVTGQWRDEGDGVFSIAFDRDKKLRALYVNGRRCYMTSKKILAMGGYGTVDIAANGDYAWVSGSATAGVRFTSGTIPLDTRNQDDIELTTQTRWNTTTVCVQSLERSGLFIGAKLQMPYGAIAQTLGWGNEYQFNDTNTVYNVFEWLDEPGEFYFDKTEKRLYYYPREGEDLSSAEVIVPSLETLVDVCGADLGNNVSHLTFRGITFAYTDWNLCEVDGSHGRATNQGAATLKAYAEEDWHGYLYRAYDVDPAAVQVSGANNLTFVDNEICHTGSEGLSLVNDVTDTVLLGNAIYDTSGSALLIGHPQHAYIGDKNSGKGNHSDKEKYDAKTEGLCQNLTVTDNMFKDTSRLFPGAAGVMVYFCDGLLFRYNQVENTPYSGISLGWGWWNLNGSADSVVPGEPCTSMKNNKILNNRFINTITTLSDAGAIYTIGDMPGTEISENYIDTIGSGGTQIFHIRGIHIDEGTMHVYGEKNVIDIDPDFTCIDCGDWGNKGYNTWDNNYSTSSSYTTTDSYEPGTVITNAHTVPDANWDEAALAIIDAAGIRAEYLGMIDEPYYSGDPPTSPQNDDLPARAIAAICIGAVVLIAAVATGVTVAAKRRKTKSI